MTPVCYRCEWAVTDCCCPVGPQLRPDWRELFDEGDLDPRGPEQPASEIPPGYDEWRLATPEDT